MYNLEKRIDNMIETLNDFKTPDFIKDYKDGKIWALNWVKAKINEIEELQVLDMEKII